MRKLLTLAFILTFASLAHAQMGTLSGVIQTPNSSIPIVNGTLNLTLSQSGVVVGSAAITSSPVACYTSTDGSIVGLKNPLIAPAPVPGAFGSLPMDTYFVRYTAYGSGVESLPSAEASTVLPVTGHININLPSVPAGQTGWKVYISTTSGIETLQGSTLTNTYVQSTALVSGAALPGSNTSICQLRFNDTIIPYPTKYRVSLVDRNGAAVPGFGFFVYLSGSVINVSNGWPTARDLETRYFTPIISAPASNASQSINSPLTLNGFQLSAGSVLGSGIPTVSAPGCPLAAGVMYYDSTLNKWEICQNGGAYADVIGGGTGWQRAGGIISASNLTDKVLVGFSTTDIGAAPALISNLYVYAIDSATNARLLGLSMNDGASKAVLVSGVSGTQATGFPLAFSVCPGAPMNDCHLDGVKEAGRIEIGGRWVLGLQSTLSSDYPGGALVVEGLIAAVNGPTNAQGITMSATGGAGGSSDIASTLTGTGTYKSLSFTTSGTRQVFIDPGGRLLLGTSYAPPTTVENTHSVLEAVTDTNTPTFWRFRNANTGTAAKTVLWMIDGANDPATETDLTLGTTSSGFTPAAGFLPSQGWIETGPQNINGLLMYSVVGPLRFAPGGTTVEATLTNGTGLALNHALPVTSGGTGSTSALNSTSILFASSSTAAATSANLLWAPAAGGLVAVGNANQPTATITANGTNNQSFGLLVNGGTTSSDYAVHVNQTGGLPLFIVRGDGLVSMGTRTAAATPGNFVANYYIHFKDASGNDYYVPAMSASW